MARRKRGLPQSHYSKWKQLRESDFKLKLPRPDTPSHKALVTRYHRQIFGGKNSKGKHIFGVTSHYQPYKGKSKDLVGAAFPKRKGIPRLSAALIPKGYRVTNITQKHITLESAHTKEKIYITNKRRLLLDTDNELKRVLPKGKNFRIRFSNQILHGTFDKDSIIDRYKELMIIYKDQIAAIHIEEVEFTNQKSNGEYKKAKAKARRNRRRN